MDSGAIDTAAQTPPVPDATRAASEGASTRAAAADDARSHRSHLRRDVTLIVLACVLGLAGLGVGGFFVYRALYSPSAFVSHYLSELSSGHAADALRVPGVAIDRSMLDAAGLPKNSSEALLRKATLAPLSHVRIVSERPAAGGDIDVTAEYVAGGHAGTTTFQVGTLHNGGIIPAWQFTRSPLAVIDLSVHGSMSFEVNGFPIDKRQVALAGSTVDPADPVPLLVFSPGLYSIRVDTAISASPGVAVLSDMPMKKVPVSVQTQPTEKFIGVVQSRVDDFLAQCATQQVLHPTGCPFGYVVNNRIQAPPTWSILTEPTVQIVPEGEGWAIPPTDGVARIVVDIRNIYDGSLHHVDKKVPFAMTGTIEISPSGTASIRVASPDDLD